MGFIDKYLLEYQLVDHSQSALQVNFLFMLNIAICDLSNLMLFNVTDS